MARQIELPLQANQYCAVRSRSAFVGIGARALSDQLGQATLISKLTGERFSDGLRQVLPVQM